MIAILYVLVACSAHTELPPTPTSSPMATQSSPLITPAIQASQTPVPTNTSTAIPTSTWTPLPTITTKQAREKIDNLNLNNGGWQLPCWWGFTSGTTTWPEALQ